MGADIKQLSDIGRTDNPTLPLIAFGHSMGSELTQSHIENHGDLLTGTILCGTLGAMPGLDEAQYETIIQQPYTLAAGLEARAPGKIFGAVIAGLNAPFVTGIHPTGSEWQASDLEESYDSKATRCAASPSRTP